MYFGNQICIVCLQNTWIAIVVIQIRAKSSDSFTAARSHSNLNYFIHPSSYSFQTIPLFPTVSQFCGIKSYYKMLQTSTRVLEEFIVPYAALMIKFCILLTKYSIFAIVLTALKLLALITDNLIHNINKLY